MFCIPATNWDAYLVLLGGPIAAAVLAKGIVAYQVTNGVVQKSSAQAASPTDIATDDQGDPDLVDIQYLLFNLVTLAYVVASFSTKHTLPEIPGLLLGLTGAAGAAYVANKALQTNAPVISSVVPSVLTPGTPVTVRGQNLLVGGPNGQPPPTLDAKVGGVRTPAIAITGDSDTLTLVAPPGMSSSDPTLRIVTAANVESAGFPIVVGTISVLGWAQDAIPPKTGQADAKLRVEGLPPVAQMAADRVAVTFGGRAASGQLVSDGVVQVRLQAVNADEVETTVAYRGQVSTTAKLPLD